MITNTFSRPASISSTRAATGICPATRPMSGRDFGPSSGGVPGRLGESWLTTPRLKRIPPSTSRESVITSKTHRSHSTRTPSSDIVEPVPQKIATFPCRSRRSATSRRRFERSHPVAKAAASRSKGRTACSRRFTSSSRHVRSSAALHCASSSNSRTSAANKMVSEPGRTERCSSDSAADSVRRGSMVHILPPAAWFSRSLRTGSASVVPYPCETTGFVATSRRSRECCGSHTGFSIG